MLNNISKNIIIIRGGGDIATGVVQKFHRAGFFVLILETKEPTAIRRSVALCEAVYDETTQVEDITCKRVWENDGQKFRRKNEPDTCLIDDLNACWKERIVPLLIDPNGESIKMIKPAAVVDAILAKRNTGTNRSMAIITIALGPGFYAGRDVDAVIETMRGHDLGKVILDGYATANTGIPGELAGESSRRVLYTSEKGTILHIKQIGDIVEQGDAIFKINDKEVFAPMKGLLRGLIRNGIEVRKGMKIADIDPRTDVNWRTISDKARSIGGATLEAYFMLRNVQKT